MGKLTNLVDEGHRIAQRILMDDAADRLARHLRQGTPFGYWRLGDGAIECMSGRRACTCDGEWYNQQMGSDVANAIDDISKDSAQLIGDWETAVNGSDPAHVDKWVKYFAKVPPRRTVHFEALLLNRQTRSLYDFYADVKADPRRKLVMGAEFNRPAAKMLNAEYLAVPLVDLYSCFAAVEKRLQDAEYDVLLFGAGIAGMLLAVGEWRKFPKRTYIHLGSALDPLFKGKTRSGQLSMAEARKFMGGLL